MIGRITRKAFAAWIILDEVCQRYGDPLIRDTLRNRLLRAQGLADDLAGMEDVRAVVFRGDGADEVGVPQFETRFDHGHVDSQFGELDLDLVQLDQASCSEAKSAFIDFVDSLRHVDLGYGNEDFQSVMLYLRSRSCSVRKAAKDCRVYAVRVVRDNLDHPHSKLLPWAFKTMSRAKRTKVMGRLAESVVPRNWDKYCILVDRNECVVDKLPRRLQSENPHHADGERHLSLSVESIYVPTNFAAVPNADGDWFVGNLDLMRTKNWDTRDWNGKRWLEEFSPHNYQDEERIEDFSSWSRRVKDVADNCDWWKIDLEHLDAWQWLFVLCGNPSLENRCPYWDEFTSFQWSMLLCCQPKFDKRCVCWNTMPPNAWERLLKVRPELLERIDLENASGELWAKVVKCFPEHEEDCPWTLLNGAAWLDLLSECPQYAKYCNWDRIDSDRWISLLRLHPEFERYCDRDRLSSSELAKLIIAFPCFLDECYAERLNAADWLCLIRSDHSFVDQCSRHFKITDDLEIGLLIELTNAVPQLSVRCNLAQRSSADLARILLASTCEWKQFPYRTIVGKDWVDVLARRPDLSENCVWSNLEGTDWARLLESNLNAEYAQHCVWERLNADDWFWLLTRQVKYADKCKAWDIFSDEQRRSLRERWPENRVICERCL